MSKFDRDETHKELAERQRASLDRAAQRLRERQEHPELYPDAETEQSENESLFADGWGVE